MPGPGFGEEGGEEGSDRQSLEDGVEDAYFHSDDYFDGTHFRYSQSQPKNKKRGQAKVTFRPEATTEGLRRAGFTAALQQSSRRRKPSFGSIHVACGSSCGSSSLDGPVKRRTS